MGKQQVRDGEEVAEEAEKAGGSGEEKRREDGVRTRTRRGM